MRMLKRRHLYDVLMGAIMCVCIVGFPAMVKSDNALRIQHNPVGQTEADTPIHIEASLNSAQVANSSLWLYVRTGGSKSYQSHMLTKSNEIYSAELPGSKAGDVLEYFLLLVIDGKKAATYPEKHPYVHPQKIIIIDKSPTKFSSNTAALDEMFKNTKPKEADLGDLFKTSKPQSTAPDDLFKKTKAETDVPDDLFKKPKTETDVPDELFAKPSSKTSVPDDLFKKKPNNTTVPDELFKQSTPATTSSVNRDRVKNATTSSDITILVLSPEPESKQNDEQVVLAISFLADEGAVDESSVQLFLDRQNVTQQADVSPFMISYTPLAISRGKHLVKMLSRDTKGQALVPIEFTFWVRELKKKDKSEKVLADVISIADKYQQAVDEFYFRNYKKAIEKLKSLLEKHANHPLASNFQYWIGESYYGLKEYKVALAALQLVERFRNSNKADDALVMIGMCYNRMGQEKKSQQAFQKLLSRYPKSEYMKFARKMVK